MFTWNISLEHSKSFADRPGEMEIQNHPELNQVKSWSKVDGHVWNWVAKRAEVDGPWKWTIWKPSAVQRIKTESMKVDSPQEYLRVFLSVTVHFSSMPSTSGQFESHSLNTKAYHWSYRSNVTWCSILNFEIICFDDVIFDFWCFNLFVKWFWWFCIVHFGKSRRDFHWIILILINWYFILFLFDYNSIVSRFCFDIWTVSFIFNFCCRRIVLKTILIR